MRLADGNSMVHTIRIPCVSDQTPLPHWLTYMKGQCGYPHSLCSTDLDHSDTACEGKSPLYLSKITERSRLLGHKFSLYNTAT